jgi:hypothetical protein
MTKNSSRKKAQKSQNLVMLKKKCFRRLDAEFSRRNSASYRPRFGGENLFQHYFIVH